MTRTTAVGFLPTDIAGLQLWLKADAGLYQDAAKTTPATADGHVVGAWADQSGNGNDATQATAANKPLLKLAIVNGKPVVRFDGVNDYLDLGSIFGGASDYTLFLVGLADSVSLDANGRALFSFRPDTVDRNGFLHLLYRNDITNNFRAYYSSDGNQADQVTQNPSSSYGFDQFNLHTVGAGSSAIFRLNGVQQASDSMVQATFATEDHIIASYYNNPATSYFLDGDIAEIIIYNSAILVAEIQSVESYLNTRYAIY